MSLEVGDLAIINNSYVDFDGVLVVVQGLDLDFDFNKATYKVVRLDGEPFNIGIYVRREISVFIGSLIRI